MAVQCTITKKDIRNYIRNSVKSRFSTASFVSYPDVLIGAVKYDAEYPNRTVLYGKMQALAKKLNKEFNSKETGDVVTIHTNKSDGMEISIHPTQKLANAMTIQKNNDIKPSGTANSRYNTNTQQAAPNQTNAQTNAQGNAVKPMTDNYMEHYRYRQQELAINEQKTARIEQRLRYKESKKDRDLLNQLNLVKQELENELLMLSENENEYMYHSVITDLSNILDTLNGNISYSADTISDRINHYTNFIESLDPAESDSYEKVSGLLNQIKNIYITNTRAQVIRELSEEQLILDLLENENKLEKNKDKPLTVEDLLRVGKDISGFSKEFAGLKSSDTGDTIIPQYLLVAANRIMQKNQNRVSKMHDRLEEFLHTSGMKDFDWIFSKNSYGNNDGYLIDSYTDKWFTALKTRNNLYQAFVSSLRSKDGSGKINHDNLILWHKDNTEVIDFTKLRAVRDRFENLYPGEFETVTDASINAYEQNLIGQLGKPKFDTMVENMIAKLDKFEQTKLVDSEYRERNIATKDVWKFLRDYKGGMPVQNAYNYEGENGPATGYAYFTGFDDLQFLPKSELVKEVSTDLGRVAVKEDSGYYSPEYQEMLQDPSKVEYWSILRDMSNYIKASYGQDSNSRLEYPKLTKKLLERFKTNFTTFKPGVATFGKAKESMLDLAHEYKSWFYSESKKHPDLQEDKVVSNYVNTSTKEIRDLTQALTLQGIDPKEARIQATNTVLQDYSTDINTLFKALLVEAATHESRLEMLPIAQRAQVVHASIKSASGTRADGSIIMSERTNAMRRLDNYIKTIIQNRDLEKETTGFDNNSDSKINKKFKLLSKADKELVDELNIVMKEGPQGDFNIKETVGKNKYTLSTMTLDELDADGNTVKGERIYSIGDEIVDEGKFVEVFRQFLQDKINTIGNNPSGRGFIDGITKTFIYNSLVTAPFSGMNNRLEGMNTSMIMDHTGTYWTTGNIDIARSMMSYANINRLTFYKIPLFEKKKEQMKIFQLLLKKLDVLQNRQDELQKNADRSKLNFDSVQLFKFSVELPEFKNQGEIILATMMDTVIDGVPFIDKETGEFNFIYQENGVLKVKPEYADTFDFESDEMVSMTIKSSHNVSHSQGDYSKDDIKGVKINVLTRLATVFLTYLHSHWKQRWGTAGEYNYNLTGGKKAEDGRFIKAAKRNPFVLATFLGVGSLALYGITPVLAAGVAVVPIASIITAMYTKGALLKLSDFKPTASKALEIAALLQHTLKESLNYPFKLIPGASNVKLGDRTIGNSKINLMQVNKMDKETIQNITALAQELAIMLTFLGLKLAYGAFAYDDDEDKESSERKKYNKVQGLLSRNITNLGVFTNPQLFLTDHGKLMMLERVNDVLSMLGVLGVLDGEVDDTWFQKTLKTLGVSKEIINLTKGNSPFEQDDNFDENLMDWRGTVKPLYWTVDLIKNNATDGEFGNEREYKEVRADLRDEKKKELMEEFGNNKHVLQIITNHLLSKEIGSKYPGISYKEALEKIENGEVMKKPKVQKKGRIDPIKEAKERERKLNNFKKSLKKQNVSNEEIQSIVERFF